MHGPSSDEAFKALNVWPQVDAHHPLADRILSPGVSSSKDFRQWSFNIFDLGAQELGMLAATVLAETGLPRVFGISMKVWHGMILLRVTVLLFVILFLFFSLIPGMCYYLFVFLLFVQM